MNNKAFTMECPIVAFDLETTGLDPKVDDIIQLGYISQRSDGGTPVEVNRLMKPSVEIPPFITELTGISNDMVQGAKPFKYYAKQLAEAFQQAKTIITYNGNKFDIMFLDCKFRMLGIKSPFTGDQMYIDGLLIARHYTPMTLGAVCKRLGIELGQAHDALSDIRATIDVILKFAEMNSDFANTVMQQQNSNFFSINEKGEYVFAHGKHQDNIVGKEHKGYLGWLIDSANDIVTKIAANNLLKSFK